MKGATMGTEEGGYEFNRSALLECLPYGQNFLFLDSALVSESFTNAQGTYAVPAPEAHPVLRDHFPNLPIFPGHLQAEGAAQLAVLLVIAREKERAFYENRRPERLLPLLTFSSFTFNTLAIPGNAIEYEIFVANEEGRNMIFTVTIKVDDGISKGTVAGKVVPYGILERSVLKKQRR